MDREEALALLRGGEDGVKEWNRRREDGETIPTLSEADLRGANLSGANLSDAILGGAILSGANLSDAILSGANLNDANLIHANLIHADLSRADLSDADLRSSNLIRADLRRANLTRALTWYTSFVNVDLSEVTGLEKVIHGGPSSLGTDTLYKSRGKIPEVFLRGCGVPDELIAYLPSLLGAKQAIEFYSCFISYSHQDEEFTKRLHSRMRDEHLRVWYAPEDMKGGEKIREQIDSAIRVHDKLLLVLSEKSMSSDWVAAEIRRARQREVKEKRRVLFPIRLIPMKKIDAWERFDAGEDRAREIREYFIPDFSNWKDHDVFEAAFTRLLSDLKEAADS